jgi:hypothetical protein
MIFLHLLKQYPFGTILSKIKLNPQIDENIMEKMKLYLFRPEKQQKFSKFKLLNSFQDLNILHQIFDVER